MLDRRQFVWYFISSLSAAGVVLHTFRAEGGVRRPAGRTGAFPPPPERVGCLYNGFLLTVDPGRALAEDPTERNRLYMLHAVLIDTATGRIAATFPSLPSIAGEGDVVAHPVEDYPNLSLEHPPPPDVTAGELVQYWRARGVAPELLTGIWLVDLSGAVVTPGLIDDHFHVSSWSKKLAPEGQRFGFYADVGDPAYYTDPATWDRFCSRKVLWKIVADANDFLAEQDRNKIYLHGFWNTEVDRIGEDGYPESFLFSEGEEGSRANPRFLINRIGRGATAPVTPPADPCNSDPESWPPLDYETVPALLVHTSGQACWYNSALLEAFNASQEEGLAAFPATTVEAMTPPAEEDDSWSIELGSSAGAALLSRETPFAIDLVVPGAAGESSRHLPFSELSVDVGAWALLARAMLPGIAEEILEGGLPPGSQVIPFARPIPLEISEEVWNAAAGNAGEEPETERQAYGCWDPTVPYGTNWYNGAERGLVEFVHDEAMGVWRPSGYAEHYVMRDRLSAYVLDPLTPEESMSHRRRLARWCRRHGITSVQDIMFYRREGSLTEFAACEGLSYDHRYPGGLDYYPRWDVSPSVETGGLNLRIGLYYYVENAGGIPEVLELVLPQAGPTDLERLRPPEGHPEYPGWVRWTGWKLQLDGGVGARTLFSSAPLPKPAFDDPYTVTLEGGQEFRLTNHSFGLLTMTNLQEQVLTSRESAALYWLVRESDPASVFHNPRMGQDWTFLKRGVAGWLDTELDQEALAADLGRLGHVDLPDPDQMVGKLAGALDQVRSGWERTLGALARIWYEGSVQRAAGHPMPTQVACHALGDGGADIWVRAIRQLRDDLAAFPSSWAELPSWWQSVIPEDADLSVVRRTFEGERYRVEHWINVSSSLLQDLQGPAGLDRSTSPAARNVVFSTQPALLVLDGEAIKSRGFPYAQELWDIPNDGTGAMWLGVPARPRWHHHMPAPLLRDRDIPFSLSSDPPAVRDPRPAITLIGAVARMPVEIDPEHWVNQQDGVEPERPTDYLVGATYGPLGLTPSTPGNPMHLSMAEALVAMTFWAAYVVGWETEVGALAPPGALAGGGAWWGDLVVWMANPLAIEGPSGMHLEDLATLPEGQSPVAVVQMCNAFIRKFRPLMTLVSGIPVWAGE